MKSDEPKPECVLCGGFACGNVGDEITLAVALKDCRGRFGDSLAVLSKHPDYTRRQFPDVAIIPYVPRQSLLRGLRYVLRSRGLFGNRWSARYSVVEQGIDGVAAARPWVRAVAGCRELYVVGGGYISDLFDFEYWLLPLQVAAHFSVKVKTAPLGLGPFMRQQSADLVAESLRTADVTVRDEGSAEFCRRHGITAENSRDDGFRLLNVMPELRERRKNAEPEGAARLGVCAHPQYGSGTYREIEKWWVRFLDSLVKSAPDVEVEGLCFHARRGRDYAALRRIFRLCGLDPRKVQPPFGDFRDAVRSLCRYSAVVTSRFHAAVVSNVLGIPCLAAASGEYYANKMAAAIEGAAAPSRLVQPPGDLSGEAAEFIRSVLPGRNRGRVVT